jgi:hypothetical protein
MLTSQMKQRDQAWVTDWRMHMLFSNQIHSKTGSVFAQLVNNPSYTKRTCIQIFFHEQWHRKSALFLASLLPSSANLVKKCLGDPNGCYTFREELRRYLNQWTRHENGLNEILEMNFSSPVPVDMAVS